MSRFLIDITGYVLLIVAGSPVMAEPSSPTPRSWKFERDQAGRLVRRQDPSGRELKYVYGPSGALEKVGVSDGSAISYTYTSQGLRESMSDGQGTTRYEHNALDFPKSVTFPGNHKVSYQYDLRGRLRRIELSDGWWMAYEYDLMDRLVSVDSKLGKIQYEYFPSREIDGRHEPTTVRRLPNGVTTIWIFDADIRLVRLEHERGGELLAAWAYEYDGWDRIVGIRDLRTNDLWQYFYDSISQLTEVRRNEEPMELYAYDVGSNQLKVTRGGETKSFSYDSSGQLVSAGMERFAYSPAGELINRQSPTGTQRYRYDATGRLTVVEKPEGEIRYTYDGDGNLVERRKGQSVESYLYHVATSLPQLLAVYGPDHEPLAHHLLGPNHLAVQYRSGDVVYLLEDHLQSVRVVTDAQGRPLAGADYSAFGHTFVAPTQSSNLGFIGEWQDPQTGLVLLKSRWYDPQLGRFISPDPIGGILDSIVSLNRYAYARNDPVNWIDRNGLEPRPWWLDLFNATYAKQWYAEAAERALASGNWFMASVWDMTGGYIGGEPASRGQAYAQIFWSVLPLSSGLQAVNRAAHVFRGVSAARAFVSSVIHAAEGHPWKSAFDIVGLMGTWSGLRAQALPGEAFLAGQYHFDLASGKVVSPNQYLFGFGLPEVMQKAAEMRTTSQWITVFGLGRQIPKALRAAGLLEASAPDQAPDETEIVETLPGPQERTRRAGPKRDQFPPPPPPPPPPPFSVPKTGPSPLPPFPPLPPEEDVEGGLPAVGGVLLDKAAEVLGAMGTIRGVQYEADTGRILLIGDAGETKTSRVRASDLAVALRAALEEQWPGVSIDPPPGDRSPKNMHYRYIGPTQWTRFGLVMGYADRLMKCIGLGEDNENPGKKIRPDLPDFKDQAEWVFLSDVPENKWIASRFWLVPGAIQWQVSPDGKTLWCSSATVKVRTQVMKWNPQKGQYEDDKSAADPSAEKFAKYFTEHYDELARLYPVYEELRQLAALVGLAAWLKEHLPKEEFVALVYCFNLEMEDTPTTTPSLTVQRKSEDGRFEVTLFGGGVDLTPEIPKQATETAQPSSHSSKQSPKKPGEIVLIPSDFNHLREETQKALPPNPVPAVTQVDLQGGRHRVLSLPLAAQSSLGSLSLRETDLSSAVGDHTLSLSRHYNSTHTERSASGRGWQWLLPELSIRRWGQDTDLFITDAWRSFETLVEAPSFTRRTQTEEGKLLLTESDGATWEFDPNRKLSRYDSKDIEWTCDYERGRPKRFSLRTKKDGKSGFIELSYNEEAGLVVSARDHTGRSVTYQYDTSQRLISSNSDLRSMRYDYDSRHHLTSSERGNRKRSFAYDENGYLTQQTREDGSVQKYQREATEEGGSRIRMAGSAGPEILLDPHGRVKQIRQGDVLLNQKWQGGEQLQELVAGGEALAHTRYSHTGRTMEVDIPGDRHENLKLAPDGTLLYAEIVSATDRSKVQIGFDQAGLPEIITDPAGGEYRDISEGKNSRNIVTPVGAYQLVTEKEGRTARLRTPSGREFSWGYGADNLPERVTVKDPLGEREWLRTAPQSWTLKAGEKLIAKLQTDEAGRVVELADASGATVKAKHGEGGSVVSAPDGRQLVVKKDASGRIVEFQEHPAGSPRSQVPPSEMVGKPKVRIHLEELPRSPMKRR